MPHEYLLISDGDVTAIRRQRLRSLEADHALTRLVLEEDPTDPRANADAVELWRRIEHHRARLLPDAVDAVSPFGNPADEPATATRVSNADATGTATPPEGDRAVVMT